MAAITTRVVGAAVVIIVLAAASGLVVDATSDDDLYVFVIAGQSNAAYFNYNVNATNEEVPIIPQGSAFYYGTATQPIYYGRLSNPTYDTTFESYGFHDLIGDSGKYVIGNIEAPFASQFFKETGKSVYLINTAIPGQPIDNMIPGELGDDYARAVFSHAMSVIPNHYHVIMGSILFLQGESDSDTSVESYKTDFMKVFDSYKSFAKIDSILISETRPSDGVNSSVAQLELCDENDGIYLGSTAATGFVNGTRYMAGDGLHYSQYGDNVIGKDLANCYIENLYHSSMDFSNLWKIVPVLMIVCSISAVLITLVTNRND